MLHFLRRHQFFALRHLAPESEAGRLQLLALLR
jgi:hypothetical protein